MTKYRNNRRIARVALALTAIIFSRALPASGATPITGAPVSGLEAFDQQITDLMSRWQVPGGAVAVVKDGRLVYARGFGWADTGANEPVQPDALFRIASVSKPIASATVLKLIERGLLGLDDKAFAYLPKLKPPAGATVDSRIQDITIRNLLQHSGGWDRDKTFDPMFNSDAEAQAVGAPAPASCETVIRYMLGRPLDFTPGTEYVYSNFGYCVLGRIVEQLTKQKYEDYVKDNILAPLRVSAMRTGHTKPADRALGEVHYYDFPGAPLVPSVFPGGGSVAEPDGGFYLEAMATPGGWIATTTDLLRFLTAVDGLSSRPDFLQPATIDLMLSHPLPPLWVDSPDAYYGMGWQVLQTGGDIMRYHEGDLAGTLTLLWRGVNGLGYAALFNMRPFDRDSFTNEIFSSLGAATNAVTQWPAGDLFEPCAPAPEPGCESAASGKGTLVLKNGTTDAKDSLTWTWVGGAATAVADFADPVGASTYTLCAYDEAGGVPTLKLSALVAGGATSKGRPCWKATSSGFTYADPKTLHDGLHSMQLKAGAAGKGKTTVKGKGTGLRLPSFPLTAPVTVQLKNSSGKCWGAAFSTAKANDAKTFKASSD